MPLLYITVAFLSGILLAITLPFSWLVWVCLAVVFLALAILDRTLLQRYHIWLMLRKRFAIPPGLVLLFLSLGALRYLASLPVWNETDLAYYNDRGKFTITAQVSAPPDRRQDVVYLEVKVLEIEDQLATNPLQAVKRVKGKARVSLATFAEWEYGDLLRFSGLPLTPDDDSDFSYKDYLSRQGIDTVIYYPGNVQRIASGQGSPLRSMLEKIRERTRAAIFRQFPMPESGLLSGILLGLDNDMPMDLKQAYRDTGTAHIIAISGFNMAVLAGFVMWLFSRIFNLYWATLLTALILAGYTLLVGAPASVVRAAVMACTAFAGHLIGRRQAGMNALWLTAALMCVVNPRLVEDASFQLSFAATFGLVLFAQPLQDWAEMSLARILPEEKSRKLANPLSKYLLFTLAAQLTTLPVIALQFGRISVSSLLANPLVLPLQPVLLILGGTSAVAGALLPVVGKILAIPAWSLLAYTNRAVELLGRIKGGSLVIYQQTAIWILAALVIFILLFIFRNFFKKLFGKYFTWVVYILILCVISVWSMFLHRPDGRLHIDLYRTRDESSLFLRTPDGQAILFDPGENLNELTAAIGRDLSPWNFHLDEIWVTNRSAAQHLKLINERLPVSRAILMPPVYQAAADQVPIILPEDFYTVKLKLGESHGETSGVSVRSVAGNTTSTALFVSYQDISILIPNGVDFAVIRDSAPEVFENLTILVLSDEDTNYIPPRVWQALKAQIVLWNSASVSPTIGWVGSDLYAQVSLISDGTEICAARHEGSPEATLPGVVSCNFH